MLNIYYSVFYIHFKNGISSMSLWEMINIQYIMYEKVIVMKIYSRILFCITSSYIVSPYACPIRFGGRHEYASMY